MIDWEKCLYLDFGNGFSVEMSGCRRANRRGPVTLYFWYSDSPSCFIVHIAHDIGRNADAIGMAAEKPYDYSRSLLSHGYDTAPMYNLYLTTEYIKDDDGRTHRRCRLHAKHPHNIEMTKAMFNR